MDNATSLTRLDIRTVAPPSRHALVLMTLRRLRLGDALELVNDHDPAPLHCQLRAEAPGTFGWDCLESGPPAWRVRVTRLPRRAPSGAAWSDG